MSISNIASIGKIIFSSLETADLDVEVILKLFNPENLKVFASIATGIRKVEINPIEFPEPINPENVAQDSWYEGLKLFQEDHIRWVDYKDLPDDIKKGSIEDAATWISVESLFNDGKPFLAYGWYHMYFLWANQFLINTWDKTLNYVAIGTRLKGSNALIRMVHNGEFWMAHEISFDDPVDPKDRFVFHLL